MFSINYEHTNYGNLIYDVATKMEVCAKKDFFIVPHTIGNGYFRYVILSNGLQCLITNYRLNEDIYITQKSSEEEFYTLRFTESSPANKLAANTDKEYVWDDKDENGLVVLTSSLFDFAYMVPAGTAMKTINILIPRTWILKTITIDNADVILKKYLKLRTSSYNFAPFDAEYQDLFNQIMNHQNKAGTEDAQATTRRNLMVMLQKFLDELTPKLDFINTKDKIKISADEVKRLMKVESYLLKDFSIPPPSINSLSRVAAMSTTSLKSKFKKMFGSTLYEYYQKSRMQRAKILILTHKYSIKQVGSQLGYCNLSNFSIAFKKEFKRLPSQYSLGLSSADKY